LRVIYDRSMKRFPKAALAAVILCSALGLHAQGATPPQVDTPPANSGMDAELFYQLLLGELNVHSSEPGAGFALILDAARKTHDPALYQRAVELAFEARNGDAALQAARAWKQAFPQSREANRYVLQILVALNRIPESAEPLKAEIALTDAHDRTAVMASIPRIYSRATDRKQAAAVVEQALSDYLNQPDTAAAAWGTVGRMRLAAGDNAGALDAARRGQAVDATAEAPALLALELMDPKLPQAETLVRNYLAQRPLPEIRMGYARALLDEQRHQEALQQLAQVTREHPEYPEAWLAQGVLLVQDNQLPQAEASVKQYLDLVQKLPASEEHSRGQAQAYLSMSQIYEKRGDYATANAWLDRIQNSQDLVSAQNRRASILARQGKVDEALQLLRAIPERTPADARMKVMAEVALLRDNKLYQRAYDLLAQTAAKDPQDVDLVYDQAMMAEKLGDFANMERLLREIIAKKPDYQHAYNALGFSLAERNERLPEARKLVQKALEFAPGDPFITDSLAWVEFRMGNKAQALQLLQGAFKERPDPEIAAHLGEVLWTLGERQQAESVWREGLLLSSDNDTLLQTLKRYKVKP
jgi:predicted Zn-dependent protease